MKTYFIILIAVLMSVTFNNLNAQCIAEAGPDQNVCGFTTNMNAISNPLNQSETWTCQYPGVIIDSINNPTTSVCVQSFGTYVFYWHVVDQFGDACFSSVNITFRQLPNSDFITSPIEHLLDTVTVTYTGNASLSAEYLWYIDNGTIVGGMGQGPLEIATDSTGTVSICLTVLEYYCQSDHNCESESLWLTNCNGIAGQDSCINSLATNLYAVSNPANQSEIWSCNVPGVVIADPTSNTSGVTVPESGTYNFKLSIIDQLGDTCFDNVQISFIVPEFLGSDFTVCGYDAQLNGPDGVNGYWYASICNVYYLPDSYTPDVHVRIPNYVIPSYAVTFFYHQVISSYCQSSDTLVVTFIKPPHVDCGAGQSVCGYTTVLNADTLGGGLVSGYWQCSIPAITITPNVPGPIPATVTVDASTAAGLFQNSMLEAWFYWTGVSASSGCSGTDSVLVFFYEIPNAYAGEDDSVCGKTYDLIGQYSLDNPDGNWTVLTKPFVTSSYDILPPNNPDGEVTVSDNGIWQFIWSEYNAGNHTCFDRDTITINFMTIPHPYAGPDQSVCGSYVELYANTTPGTDGYWQSLLNAWHDPTNWPNDTVSCLPCSNDSSVVAYYPSTNVTVTYYWMEFNGQCYGYDSVDVYFGSIQPALSLTDPADSTTCGRIYTGLNAQTPAYGNGFWYDTTPLSQFYPTNYSTTPDSVMIHASAYGLHNFYWVTVNGNCRDTSDVVPVWFGGTGVITGNITGLGGYTDFTAAVYESGSPIAIGSGTPDAAGIYSVVAPAGSYYLKVNVEDPTAHTGMATTYFGDTWKWADALTVNIPGCDTITANITMYTFPFATSGQCRAYGTIMYDNGGPLENTDVYLLYKPSNTPAILEKTNASGYFSLNNIPTGNYKIQVDIPGLPQVTTHHITVNTFDTLFPDVNFIVDTTVISKDYGWGIYADSNLVYGIGEPLSLQKPVKVFPIPFSNELFLESFTTSPMTIEWYSEDGRMISSSEINISEGRSHLDIPAGIDNGVYYLKVVSGNTVYVKKLVRE